ncbi:hypothetical protein OF83DRAFT_1167128 [Amylostereum chailletii]|nr:hypothetical protein OF83DRAFT_1167128 [Amylostereum chailletii]
MSQPGQSPLSAVFLLHIALEIPLGIQGAWAPATLPFMQLNNTALVFLKLYGLLIISTCIASLLCYPLPGMSTFIPETLECNPVAEFMAGKRALALSLCIYHTIASTILFKAPRFIPMSLGDFFEAYKFTPEVLWGGLHGILGLGFVVWWQGTVAYVQMVTKAQ